MIMVRDKARFILMTILSHRLKQMIRVMTCHLAMVMSPSNWANCQTLSLKGAEMDQFPISSLTTKIKNAYLKDPMEKISLRT